MRDVLIDIAGGKIGLLRGTGTTVYRRIDTPDSRMLVQTLQSHRILIFRPDTLLRHPQTLVHGLQDGLSLFTIGLRILSKNLSDTRCQAIATVVVGRAMGHSSSIIVEGIAGPDAAVGIIEMVAVRVVVALFPGQMRLDDRPHLAHIDGISIILEVPQQFVDIVEVHVVVVHLVIAFRITADVAIRVHLCAPLLRSPGKVECGVLRGMGYRRLYIGHLALGVCIEVRDGTIVPTEYIAQIACPPSCQRHAPSNTAMQPCLSVPVAIGSQH